MRRKLDGMPYTGHLWLVVGEVDEIERLRGARADLTDLTQGLAVSWQPEDNPWHFAVWLPEFEWTVTAIVSLAHECKHICDEIWVRIGAGEDTFSEAYSYYLDHIFRQSLNIVRPRDE